jgi:hypothetical protein
MFFFSRKGHNKSLHVFFCSWFQTPMMTGHCDAAQAQGMLHCRCWLQGSYWWISIIHYFSGAGQMKSWIHLLTIIWNFVVGTRYNDNGTTWWIKPKIVGDLAVAQLFPTNTSLPRLLHLRISKQNYVAWNHAYSQQMPQTHLLTWKFFVRPVRHAIARRNRGNRRHNMNGCWPLISRVFLACGSCG